MIAPWRPLTLAAALNVTVVAGAAMAQTVTVMNASPGSTIEVAMNTTSLGSATVDNQGRASVPVGATAMGGRTSINVRVYVDTCDKMHRIVLVEPGVQALAADACARQDIAGVYRWLPVSTFVVDIGGSAPTVRLRQGPAPIEWFVDEAQRPKGARSDFAPRAGFSLFAGGGMGNMGSVVAIACGNVTECKGSGNKFAVATGATVWVAPFLALEGAYLWHPDVTTEGSGSAYRFTSSFGTHIAEGTVKVGWAFNRVRPYLMGGPTYTWSTSTVTQTIDDTTVTTDTETTTIPGGTQTFELKTKGWGWMAGAGLEIPVSKMFALYSEAGRVSMKGSNVDGGEGTLDDRSIFWVAGFRLRIGR